VGQDDAPDLTLVLPQIREVRQNEVYPRHLFLGEGHARVDEHDATRLPQGSHVLAYFSQAPKGHHL
jgi:hypothetical protein